MNKKLSYIDFKYADQECGSRKTSAFPKIINEGSSDQNYLYVCPRLDNMDNIESELEKQLTTPRSIRKFSYENSGSVSSFGIDTERGSLIHENRPFSYL